jgi:hypothetical protein
LFDGLRQRKGENTAIVGLPLEQTVPGSRILHLDRPSHQGTPPRKPAFDGDRISSDPGKDPNLMGVRDPRKTPAPDDHDGEQRKNPRAFRNAFPKTIKSHPHQETLCY